MSAESFDFPTKFSHVRPQDTAYAGEGLRDFFLYRDLGIAHATGGKVLAQLVKAHAAPEQGTGWHRHQAPGIVHYLFDYSEDMEYLEIVGPADFRTLDATPPCDVPAVTPWVKETA
jgi:hypothetical protein